MITGVVGSDGYAIVMARTDGLRGRRDENVDHLWELEIGSIS